jgi:hypothetical protein
MVVVGCDCIPKRGQVQCGWRPPPEGALLRRKEILEQRAVVDDRLAQLFRGDFAALAPRRERAFDAVVLDARGCCTERSAARASKSSIGYPRAVITSVTSRSAAATAPSGSSTNIAYSMPLAREGVGLFPLY